MRDKRRPRGNIKTYWKTDGGGIYTEKGDCIVFYSLTVVPCINIILLKSEGFLDKGSTILQLILSYKHLVFNILLQNSVDSGRLSVL